MTRMAMALAAMGPRAQDSLAEGNSSLVRFALNRMQELLAGTQRTAKVSFGTKKSKTRCYWWSTR